MFFYGEIMDTYRRADGRRHWTGCLLSPDGDGQKPEHCPSNQGAGTPRAVARKRHPQEYHVEQPLEIGAGGRTDFKSARAGNRRGWTHGLQILMGRRAWGKFARAGRKSFAADGTEINR